LLPVGSTTALAVGVATGLAVGLGGTGLGTTVAVGDGATTGLAVGLGKGITEGAGVVGVGEAVKEGVAVGVAGAPKIVMTAFPTVIADPTCTGTTLVVLRRTAAMFTLEPNAAPVRLLAFNDAMLPCVSGTSAINSTAVPRRDTAELTFTPANI